MVFLVIYSVFLMRSLTFFNQLYDLGVSEMGRSSSYGFLRGKITMNQLMCGFRGNPHVAYET